MKKIKTIYIAAAIVFLGLVGLALAIVPPPPVNQSIGTYDTRVDKYTESLCRNCHNSTTLGGVPTRHHNLAALGRINTETGQPYGCQDCHPATPGVGNGVLIDRNCVDCHNGSAFWGNTLNAHVNITRPHHIRTSNDSAGIGEPAQTRQCNFCHGSFVANYNDSHYIPSYDTSFMITPYADFKAYNETSGRYWGGCYACHQNSSSESPVVMTMHDTHHGAISGWGREGGINHQKDATPGRVCTWCHLLSNPHNATVNVTINGVEEEVLEFRNSTLIAADIANGSFEPGTTVTINGTACEKCHSVQSIHNIQYNYTATKGQPGYGHIGTNWDCNGCHASWAAADAPLQGAIIPSVDSITPSVLLAGSANDITIKGMNFVNDVYTSVVSVDGIIYTPTSITDTQIVVKIPALNAGVHTLQLVKGGDAKSKLATLTVVTQTTVTSAQLAKGIITIKGTNFGPQPDPVFSDLGVFITHTVKGKPTTFRATIISWSDTSIVVNAGTATVNDPLTVKDLNGQASITVTKSK